jgi:signal transduction histidine kinase
VKLTVTDHGIGIAEDQLDNIFKPYHRLSERYRGSGLGLSLVKHSVEAHRGTISVSSRAGEGSCFTVILPVYRGDRDVVKG